MLVTLEEAKLYLRIDSDDEDSLVTNLISSAEALCKDVARLFSEELAEQSATTRVAILYTIAYLYEHREEADYHELILMLRSLLFGVRRQVL
ncbi:MAG: head-tail connector protein [Hornefia butyriciproducens]|uniref:head-tail connector protein n=1 Tax=Hornefia butyriciproducens TaxID=2652293 RepID=UPI002A74E102|nr:head-tail connector protein [Hornefia butyriciproducens]MDY2990600.1 head-tail connector protein [Hornefia butyriciproducens]